MLASVNLKGYTCIHSSVTEKQSDIDPLCILRTQFSLILFNLERKNRNKVMQLYNMQLHRISLEIKTIIYIIHVHLKNLDIFTRFVQCDKKGEYFRHCDTLAAKSCFMTRTRQNCHKLTEYRLMRGQELL